MSSTRQILITGSTGFIGRKLTEHLSSCGHEVKGLLRSGDNSKTPYWKPEKEEINLGTFRDIECVIHLAGENIAQGRWTKNKKEEIKNSRINGTKLICKFFSKQQIKPKILISGSAIGFYGNRGNEELSENSKKGAGFLSDVCKGWEEATMGLSNAGVRVVHLRTGMVIGSSGGALKKMLTPFKLGLGGVIGSGRQFMSWISIKDVITVIEFVINNNSIKGPINLVSPSSVTNHTFTKTLGSIIHRPTILPMPAFVAKCAIGEMVNELLLSSTKVVPEKLIHNGYKFHHSSIEEALKDYTV